VRGWQAQLPDAQRSVIHESVVSVVKPALHERHQEVLRLIRDGSWEAAQSACRELTDRHPQFVLGWYLAAQIAVRRTGAQDALAVLEKALELEPAHPPALLLKAQCLASLGRLTETVACAAIAREHAPPEGAFWDALGAVLSRAGQHQQALAACEEAVRLAPGSAKPLFNRAAVRRSLGELTGAEEDYDRVIAIGPAEFEAYRHRSDLRTQTLERNHVTELQAALDRSPSWRGEVQLRYALAKEYEDLGEHEKSFEQLQKGARLRREHMRYDVKTDVATINWIREAFPDPPPAASSSATRHAPIFIVGLPSSGSTLVERILGSHPQVAAAGELDCFARALVEAVRSGSLGRQLSRREMVARSAQVNFAALGCDYVERARAAGAAPGRFIDKMPLNYLYCGLIRRALPHASIVHVSCLPLAACYSIHKTLFEDGYPFSYDLAELGQYYVAYRRLMGHWQRTLPGAIHELSYENLISDQLGETRRLLQHCGLEWDDACVELHLDPVAVTTESASQSRQPPHVSPLSQWRHHETHLASLRAQLMAAGIEVEQGNE
jgi:tetratricopeptide (TPR) repeat protein